ncbi:MAG: transcription initiation factor IIB [Candidatus Helarchaeota archaeon]
MDWIDVGQDHVEMYPIYEPSVREEVESKKNNPYYDCCENPDVIAYRGIYVCRNCAIVFGPVIDDSPKRAFTREEIEKRRIREPVYTSIGPRTIINVKNEPVKDKVLYYRLAKINKSVSTTFERNLTVAQPKLLRLVSQLGIPPSIMEEALKIYSRVVQKHLTMGRSIENLVAAAVFIACRTRCLPRTIEEIAEAANIPLKVLSKNYRLILRELKLILKPLTAKYFVERFISELNLTNSVQNRAQQLLELVETAPELVGKDPKGLAAAAIYVAIRELGRKEHRSQTQISQTAHISEVTLRNRVKNIKNALAVC